MGIKVGIPRSLFYYKFFTLWETFFSELGYDVVVSDLTNKRILDDGVKLCVDEACLPIKLYHGHVVNLRGSVDYIFIPRFTSISKMEYICPEFGGLPDMIRHTIRDLPTIIDTEINMRRSDKGALKAAIETANFLGKDKKTGKRAFRAAVKKHNNFRQQALLGEMPYSWESTENRRTVPENRRTVPENRRTVPRVENRRTVPQVENRRTVPRVGVIGHPYNIYDKYVSMDLLEKLEAMGIEAITIEMVGEKNINEWALSLEKPAFWNYGRNAHGAALYLAGTDRIDGMICVTSFGCGIDSFVYYFIEKVVKETYRIPFTTITLDEHSGEAGFNTRLEAFVDMLQWRISNENNISSSG